MDHSISDFVIRIKNSAMARRREVVAPYSNIIKEISKVLKKEGFLDEVKEVKDGNKKNIHTVISYDRRSPVLNDVKIVSKPSLRVYVGFKSIGDIEKRGKHIVILSTNQGIMTGKDAKKKGVGGEVLFEIW